MLRESVAIEESAASAVRECSNRGECGECCERV